jgi:crotonobetainyl-CoA:carnitine CoA-transferase CaiB-like acyl-CoA transferase
MYALLNGIKILDLTTIVLGPYATQFLGDFGAEITKVESLDGDLFRTVRPGRSAELGAGFINCNRNKRSIAINLKTEEGQAVLQELIKVTDVVVHNMRNSTAGRLGIGYEQVKALNPRAVYCYAPGYGQHGPYADKPAYDDIIQAESGVAHLNTDSNGNPRFVPTIICDKVGGLHLAMAVLAGLVYRLANGKGCSLEAPMFEGMVSFLMTEQLAGQSFIPALGGTGYERLLSPYRKPFPTADGHISILPYSTKHWLSFLKVVGRDDIATSDIVTNPVKRSENINVLYKLISEVTPERSTEAWCNALKAEDIPFAPVNSMDDLLQDEHLKQVGFFNEYQHPTEGLLRATNPPFYVQDVERGPDRAAPRLGEDSLAILQQTGISAEQVQGLLEKGIIKVS